MSFTDARRGPALPFALAVAAAALTAAAVAMIGEYLASGEIELDVLVFGLVFVFALFVIAPLAALIGGPLTWLLARSRSEEPWVYPMAGLLAGGGLMIAVTRMFDYQVVRTVPDWLTKIAPLGAIPGFVCGAAWWFLHRRHRQGEEVPPLALGGPDRTVSRPAVAVALLMALQVAGCAYVGSGEPMVPIFCTASAPRLDWIASIQGLLLIGYFPFGLAALAVPRLRPAAILLGILALAGLALQDLLLANGAFTCDGP